MRVFMCTAGTLGLCGWAISEMPLAQKRGSSSAPGICLRNSGENSPCTVEVCTPTFSKTRPCIIDISAAAALALVALPRRLFEAPGHPGGMRAGQIVLDLLERGADPVAQLLEPRPRRRLLVLDVVGQPCRQFGTLHRVFTPQETPDGPRSPAGARNDSFFAPRSLICK